MPLSPPARGPNRNLKPRLGEEWSWEFLRKPQLVLSQRNRLIGQPQLDLNSLQSEILFFSLK